jgi:hypothetical protein
MGLKHARMLCQKLNIVTEKIELVSRASVYEYYFFSTESTVDTAEKKLKDEINNNVFIISPEMMDSKRLRILTIFTITFQKPTQLYLFQRILKTNTFESYHKFTIPRGKNPVYFVVPIQEPFFTDFHIHIIKNENDLTTAELYLDRYSIINGTMESTYN